MGQIFPTSIKGAIFMMGAFVVALVLVRILTRFVPQTQTVTGLPPL